MAKFGVHIHNDLNYQEVIDTIRATGGTVVRANTAWQYLQSGNISQNYVENGFALLNSSDSVFNSYLARRGYDSGSLIQHYNSIRGGLSSDGQSDVAVVFNFGGLPDQLAFHNNSADSNYPVDTKAVGKALFDFIIYSYRRAEAEGLNGHDVITNVDGWQIFNEITDPGGPYGPYAPGQSEPYFHHFTILKEAKILVEQAYDAIGLAQEDRPPIIGPGHGGSYGGTASSSSGGLEFWSQLEKWEASNGSLDIDVIPLHPYGVIVNPYQNPYTEVAEPNGSIPFHRAYERMLAPTDDRLTWQALTDRNPNDNYQSFSSIGNGSDSYWDWNTESGIERMMSKLSHQGRSNFDVVFTEWGASSYTGIESYLTPEGHHVNGMRGSPFMDPFKYYDPGTYYSSKTNQLEGAPIAYTAALNLQAEFVMQTVGLIEDWTFVTSATVFSNTSYNAPNHDSHEEHFGLYDQHGNLKAAGQVYFAYMAGEEFIGTPEAQSSDPAVWNGVNIIVDADNGGNINRTDTNNQAELILARNGNDYVNSGGGDDIVFGGEGNDTILGGAGYDRLYGGLGNDSLNGGSGADKLKGGTGNDTLTGGSGADQFAFAVFNNSGGYSGVDTITDFNVNQDVLAITGGYSAASILNQANGLLQTEGANVRLTIGDNAAQIILQNVSASSLSVTNFYVLEQDDTIGPVGPTTNSPPIAVNDSGYSVAPRGSTNINVLSNDRDPDGDSLTVTHINGIAFKDNGWTDYISGVGVVQRHADESITHHSINIPLGPVSFTYTVSDGQGGTANATVSGTVTTTPNTNSPPVAVNDYGLVVASQQSVNIDVLANDSDLNNDDLSITHVNGISVSPGGYSGYINKVGVIKHNQDGTLTVNHIDAAPGTDFSFNYTVSDGRGGADNATVYGSVAQQSGSVTAGTDHVVSLVDRLSPIAIIDNDTAPAGQSLRISEINGATMNPNWATWVENVGRVTVNANNTLYIESPEAYVGAGQFNYTVQSSDGSEAIGTVNTYIFDADLTYNNAYATQYLSGGAGHDAFVISDSSDNYGWGRTGDGNSGFAVWRHDGSQPHDLIYDYEFIAFDDTTVDLSLI